jgi:superfamily II DNA or RNA helicase
MPLTRPDIDSAIPEDYRERGERLQRAGKVFGLRWEASGLGLSAEVEGGGERFRVRVALREATSGRVSVFGKCSCPLGYNCEHVAAALLDALAQVQEDGPRETQAGGSERAVRPGKVPHRTSGAGRGVRRRLVYVLDLPPGPGPATRLLVKVLSAVVRRAGGYGSTTAFDTRGALEGGAPGYLDWQDLAILGLLRDQEALGPGRFAIAGEHGARLLGQMLATQRCHWQSLHAPPLSQGTARPATASWERGEGGTRHRVLHPRPEADAVLPVEPPWYLDAGAQVCGPLEARLPAPAVGKGQCVPPPREPTVSIREGGEPTPCLRLLMGELVRQPVSVSSGWGYLPTASASEPVAVPLVRLGFDYQGAWVSAGDPSPTASRCRDQVLERVVRNGEAERRLLERLRETGLEPLTTAGLALEVPPEHQNDLTLLGQPADTAWFRWVLGTLPMLRAEGWRVQVDEAFPYQVMEPPAEWYAEVDEEAGGHDWFDLELGITLGETRVNLLPLLLDVLRGRQLAAQRLADMEDDEPLLLRLDDGRYLPVPAGRVRNILGVLLELHDDAPLDPTGRLALSRLNAAQLGELDRVMAGARLRWLGGERLRVLGERLRDFQGIAPAQVPEGFTTDLRPYQIDGLSWLQFLREYGLGGILADDMGLGKTVQTLAHLLIERRSGRMDRPSLVVAPTSLMVNWQREAQRFAPELTVLLLHGPSRKRLYPLIHEHDLVLTTYPLLPRDAEALLAQAFHLVILDEAQVIKNPRAKATRVALELDARHRLCLTGTPMENHLGELWSLFNFLMPGLLGEERRFRKLFRQPIEKHADGGRREALIRRVHPFLLRRTKEQVMAELPPKTEILRTVELEGPQRDLYETIRLAMHDKVRAAVASKGVGRSHVVILDALLKLRQVCCDPGLLKMEAARRVRQSAKRALLMDLLPEMVEEGRRILLFSQFTSMLRIIEAQLREAGLPYVKLTGQTRDRATPITHFQTGEVPVFLVSLKAGGTGLNLTAADTVIHYDPWWNPAVEAQATDRAHRIGQEKPVFVYKLITAGTVEEKILALQQKKADLARSLFEGGQAGPELSAADLEALFEPLA